MMISRRKFIKTIGITIGTACLSLQNTVTASADRYYIYGKSLYELYADQIPLAQKYPIEIDYYAITSYSEDHGHNINIYWTNRSGKEIKYISFTMQAFNRVGDVESCSKTNSSVYTFKVVGPFATSSNIIAYENYMTKEQNNSLKYYFTSYIYSCEKARAYHGTVLFEPDISSTTFYKDDTTGYACFFDSERCDIKVEDFLEPLHENESHTGGIWYNPNVDYFIMTGIHIDYMDGSAEDVNPPDVIIDYAYRQRSLSISEYTNSRVYCYRQKIRALS